MFLLALAIAPGLFWLWYFLKRDSLRPEPQFLIRRVFSLGALSGIAAVILERAVLSRPVLGLDATSYHGVALAASLIGLIEEAAKFAAVYLTVYRRAEFDEVLDGIVYCVAAAMGFATLENIGYVLSGGVGVGLVRAVLSVPGHAFFGALMGYNMGRAKFAGAAEGGWLLTGVLLAALAHALFDAVLFTQTALALAVVPINAYLWRRSLVQTREAQAIDNRRIDGE